MATAAAVAFKDPVLPMTQGVPLDDYPTTKLRHNWQDNQNQWLSRQHYFLSLNSSADPEAILQVVHYYTSHIGPEALALQNPIEMYTFFKYCLQGDLRLEWSSISEARPDNQKTEDTFHEDLREWLTNFFDDTAFEDQREYLISFKKPYKTTCLALIGRLKVVNELSRYLPGSPVVNQRGSKLFADDTALKRAFFRMMPTDWQTQFAVSGFVIDDANYSLKRLVRFFSMHERLANSRAQTKRKDAPQGSKQGRSFSDVRRYNQGNQGGRFGSSPSRFQTPRWNGNGGGNGGNGGGNRGGSGFRAGQGYQGNRGNGGGFNTPRVTNSGDRRASNYSGPGNLYPRGGGGGSSGSQNRGYQGGSRSGAPYVPDFGSGPNRRPYQGFQPRNEQYWADGTEAGGNDDRHGDGDGRSGEAFFAGDGPTDEGQTGGFDEVFFGEDGGEGPSDYHGSGEQGDY